MTKQELVRFIKAEVAKETKVSLDTIEDHQSFFELGIDSINAIYLLELIEKKYRINLTPLYFWDYPTIEAFAENLLQNHFKQ